MQNHKKHGIVLVIMVLVSYLVWIDWDYRSVLPRPQIEQIVVSNQQPYDQREEPRIWSGHRELPLSAEQCARKAENILAQMHMQQIAKSGHYVYAKFNQHGVAVKCIAIGSGTFMYAIVAGQDKALIERLRNEIVLTMAR